MDFSNTKINFDIPIHDIIMTDKILQDTKLKRKQVWQDKRRQTEELSLMYKDINNKKAIRLSECGTFLEFKRFTDNSLKLHNANFCKVRLCPMCSWRRSLKIFSQVSAIMDKAELDNYRFLFLTLTLENCNENDLSHTIDSLLKGFKRMFELKKVKQSVDGWFRALEVTYNANKDTYHPHLHICLCVKPSYFSHGYIKQSEWSDMWQQSIRSEYKPILHIQTIKSGKKGVAEASKYAVKTSDIKNSNVLQVLDTSLKGRRLIAFGGLFKKLQKELSLDDPEQGDLIHTENDSLREDLEFVIERYIWAVGASGQQYYKLE